MDREAFAALLRRELDDRQIAQINGWLQRGDGCAVYENHDLSSAGLGEKQFISYGSPDAQLEVSTPPAKLPDIGKKINWRFWLIASYKGEPL